MLALCYHCRGKATPLPAPTSAPAKYDRYGPTIVGHGTGSEAHAVTIRLLPATGEGNQP